MQHTVVRPTRPTRREALRLLAALPLAGLLTVTAGSRAALDAQRVALAAPRGTPWDVMRAGGQVALIRHADAPGVSDPDGFVLADCSTQRNLSDGGRAQAARIGAAFREHGIAVDQVLTSGWCRCVDTATLAFGAAVVWSPHNSFFRDDGAGVAQTAEVRARVAEWTGPGALILVTHQVNVTALTDIFPASGEIVVLTPASERAVGFSIAGRVTVP
jgi:phosphohistidine phosphatase SixA